MANHATQSSAKALYVIIPVAVGLTLLFVKVNHNTIHPYEQLSGARVVEHKPVMKIKHAEPTDTTHVVAADTLHAEPAAPAEHTAPAEHAAPEHH
jgi:hypothetical protein